MRPSLIPPGRRLATTLLSHPAPHPLLSHPISLPLPQPQNTHQTRPSSSSQNWTRRAASDPFTTAARLKGLKSRAAWKLIEMDDRYRLFRPNQCVVDLGFAPGSWTQVAVERTQPRGRVLGIDLLPAVPPKGASAIQGNFLDEGARGLVRGWVVEVEGRWRREREERRDEGQGGVGEGGGGGEGVEMEGVELERPSYIDMERAAAKEMEGVDAVIAGGEAKGEEGAGEATEEERERIVKEKERAVKEKEAMLKTVDVCASSYPLPHARRQRLTISTLVPPQIVLSDMSAPWPQTHGFSVKSISNPYNRLMNTSGIGNFDHIGSMVR